VSLVTQTSIIAGCTVVSVRGDIDLGGVPHLHNDLVHVTQRRRGETVVVDIDAVEVCDDTGLGVLLGSAGRAREHGGDMIVVCSDRALRSRLERTGFDRAVNVVASISEAATMATAAATASP
jgi:anti-sigma B factor antagonist